MQNSSESKDDRMSNRQGGRQAVLSSAVAFFSWEKARGKPSVFEMTASDHLMSFKYLAF